MPIAYSNLELFVFLTGNSGIFNPGTFIVCFSMSLIQKITSGGAAM